MIRHEHQISRRSKKFTSQRILKYRSIILGLYMLGRPQKNGKNKKYDEQAEALCLITFLLTVYD